jgi:hypothetical protein
MSKVTGLRRAATASAIVAISFMLSAGGQSQAPRGALSQNEIRQAFIGNTIVSTPSSPFGFSEYHAPAGQMYGTNEGVGPNQNACWRFSGNQICYNYPRSGSACYWIVRSGRTYSFNLGGVVTHIATTRPGDPLKLSGKPQAWTCNDAPRDRISQTAPLENQRALGR